MADSEVRLSVPFAQIPEWVLDHQAHSDRAVRLYAILNRYGNGENGRRVPSRATLAQRLNCSEDSLDRAKKELEDSGALNVERRVGPGATNRYLLENGPDPNRTPAGSRTHAATGLVSLAQDEGTQVAAPVRHNREKSLVRVEGESSSSQPAAVSQNGYVGFFSEESIRFVGVAPVAAARARLGRDCKKFAAEGIADVVLRAAITELVQAGLGVGSFGGLVDQFHRGGYKGRTNGKRPLRYGRGETVTTILDYANKLEAEGR